VMRWHPHCPLPALTLCCHWNQPATCLTRGETGGGGLLCLHRLLSGGIASFSPAAAANHHQLLLTLHPTLQEVCRAAAPSLQ
jgi:hypothetical protein